MYYLVFAVECFTTPDEANDEFNVTLSTIIRDLNANINQNDHKFQFLCYYLVQKVSILSQKDKKQISNSKSFTDVKNVIDLHWNWSSHRLLLIMIEKLKSRKSLELLQEFDRKIDKQMKLKTVHEKLQPKTTQSSSYCKMIAVLDCQKDYSEITLEEGLEIEEFVFDLLGPIGAHLSKAHSSTPESHYAYAFIEMEWNVSTAAVDALCAEAIKHKDEFVRKSFLSLRIGDFTVINEVCNYIAR